MHKIDWSHPLSVEGDFSHKHKEEVFNLVAKVKDTPNVFVSIATYNAKTNVVRIKAAKEHIEYIGRVLTDFVKICLVRYSNKEITNAQIN